MDSLRYCDRSNWPSGPWDDEPDMVSWLSGAGLPCEMRRNSKGAWCGYVGAGLEHPAWTYARWDLRVHGDVNFGGPSENFRPEMSFPPGLHWWGFDCGHLKDLAPRDAAQPMSAGALYRDLAYVRAQCESLARQIDAAAPLAEAGYGGPRHLRGDAWSAPDWAVKVARRFEIPRAERLLELRHRAWSAADPTRD